MNSYKGSTVDLMLSLGLLSFEVTAKNNPMTNNIQDNLINRIQSLFLSSF